MPGKEGRSGSADAATSVVSKSANGNSIATTASFMRPASILFIGLALVAAAAVYLFIRVRSMDAQVRKLTKHVAQVPTEQSFHMFQEEWAVEFHKRQVEQHTRILDQMAAIQKMTEDMNVRLDALGVAQASYATSSAAPPSDCSTCESGEETQVEQGIAQEINEQSEHDADGEEEEEEEEDDNDVPSLITSTSVNLASQNEQLPEQNVQLPEQNVQLPEHDVELPAPTVPVSLASSAPTIYVEKEEEEEAPVESGTQLNSEHHENQDETKEQKTKDELVDELVERTVNMFVLVEEDKEPEEPKEKEEPKEPKQTKNVMPKPPVRRKNTSKKKEVVLDSSLDLDGDETDVDLSLSTQ